MEEVKIPNHVAIIMDGNGRWAKQRGLRRSLGHKAGADNMNGLVRHIFDSGVKVLSVYAFSTENFKRDKEEVDYLMDLFCSMFKKYANKVKDAKIIFSGNRDLLPQKVVNVMNETEEKTKNNSEHIFNICISYGGRLEIIDATKKIVKDVEDGKLNINDLDEQLYKKYLYNDLPDIDLLIRTSGEYRISNFMLYQNSYSEMYFPETLFPDFDAKEFDKAIEEFNKRDRRFGNAKK